MCWALSVMHIVACVMVSCGAMPWCGGARCPVPGGAERGGVLLEQGRGGYMANNMAVTMIHFHDGTGGGGDGTGV